ncbi:DEAD/DEAH box helicase [Streptomyces noursei ZPM]|uniref:RNA helicase n=1 Tax=Streptomyces noursei TaxID=1971 RepID=A0A401R722_STRNR|nr:DEAD/DEAH box helicase [Streptomyces noursei]AKA05883.1 DEAD/DEAH box helicase [Streptomyces noursei ZPM]UWS74287.1 DEAD/DEAH box helicase [Streptomyces noursei]GCB93429.1 helicase [Streptomyces noursei]
MARSAPPDRPPRGAYATCAQQEGHRSRQECLSDGSGPAPSGPAGRRCTNPYDGAVRPPPPPPAASHRRGKTLSTTFRDLGIFPETAEALEAVGIVSPFPIQELTLPVALSGNDVIGQAKTGTGKTLGFGLPLLERVTVPADVEAGRATPEQLTEAPQALVVVPTRELCQQVTNDLLTAGKVRNVRVLAIYGGRAYEPQVEALKKGVDVVVGTPGRLLDLAGQKKLNLSQVRTLVLDEADEMLDLGFLPDVEKILQLLPAKRQTMLFSATMPGQVISLARRYMSQPTHIRATAPDDQGATVANITQHVYRAHSLDKPEMVARMLQAEGRGLAMVFCRTKRTAADIADQLARRGFASGAVHGDLGQGAREQALRAFRNGKVDVLVCTDVAARGIDVEGVTHVINYQSPEDEKTYLHRIGRTGRAGAKGTAVTLVDWDDIPRWKLINKALELSFDEPEETYSTSPHLYEQLNIPAGTKGVLPRAERTRAGLAAEEVEDLGETGGRGRGRRSGGRAEKETQEEPRRTRTPRQRRRTRGGAPLEEPAAAGASETGNAADAAVRTAEGTEAAAAPRTPRRRRRTRGAVATAASEAAVAEHREATAGAVAEAATVPAPAAGPDAEAGQEPAAKPRRRRTRSAAKTAVVEPVAAPAVTETVVEPVVEAEAVLATVEGADAAPAKPKRTRKRAAKKTADADAAPVAVDAVDGGATTPVVADVEAPAKPKRTRTRKAAAAEPAVEAEAAVATAEGVDAAPAKPKRTRKTAATKAAAAKKTAAEPAEATDGEAPAKPKRTRKTAAAKAAEAAPEVVAVVDDAEVKPKRTRKRAAPKKTADAAAVEG